MIELLVTYMEMTDPSEQPLPVASIKGVSIARERVGVDDYLWLYRSVGGPQRWDQRLKLDQRALRQLIERHDNDIHVLRVAGALAGFLEIDRGATPDFELMHFGIVPEHQGHRLGPLLLAVGLAAAWQHQPRRIKLHTDEWDHPGALAIYQRAGFGITRQVREDVTDF